MGPRLLSHAAPAQGTGWTQLVVPPRVSEARRWPSPRCGFESGPSDVGRQVLPLVVFWAGGLSPDSYRVVAPLEVTGGGVFPRTPPARRLSDAELYVHGQAVLIQHVDLRENKASVCHRCVSEGHTLEMCLPARGEKVTEYPTTKAFNCNHPVPHPHSEDQGKKCFTNGSQDFTETIGPELGCPDSTLSTAVDDLHLR